MYGLREKLIQEQKYLEELIMKAQNSLSIVPEGHLRISKCYCSHELSPGCSHELSPDCLSSCHW